MGTADLRTAINRLTQAALSKDVVVVTVFRKDIEILLMVVSQMNTARPSVPVLDTRQK